MVEITSEEQNKVKRMKRAEDSLRDLWDHIRYTNIWIIGVPEEEEKKKGYEKLFEEIIVENFPNMEKEIRIMIVKMIKNLENQMEKMKESLNKDLEVKNKHTQTNNTIIEIKNLEGINSRISEAEKQISELEDKMVEITSEEQNKVKRMKITDNSPETSGTISNTSIFKL